ncbi:MAG TPA: hypothetical protein G4N97_09260 [Thermoflexia bacterium]|nr:hypothetical protein [Thermoflexia bacterium]
MPEEVKGYCVKCKAERVIKNVKITEVAGRRVAKGVCPVCGAEITHFLKKK